MRIHALERTWLSMLVLLLTAAGPGWAQDSEVMISGKEIVERLTRLEEGQKRLEQRIDAIQQQLEQRIDAAQQQLTLRIDAVQQQLTLRIDAIQQQLTLRIDAVYQQLNQRIDDSQRHLSQRIDELRQFMLWGFGVTFAGIFALIGFVIWDRRTTLAPAVHRIEALQERAERLEAALREFAAQSPELAESLRKRGLL